MKTFASFAVSVVILASFSLPLFADAQGSGGCTSAGGSCSISAPNDGTCAQSVEGGFYCRPNALSNPTGVNSNLVYYRDLIVGTINGVLVPVLLAVAFILFLWGVFKYYIKGADNEAERAKGHQFILWSVIGFVVIFSVWGLVNMLQSILIPGSASNVRPNYPTL